MKLRELLKKENFLYHATYKPLLQSIKENGLGSEKSKRNWNDSKPGYVYLTKDKDVAISYAETSDTVPEEWLDEIIVLRIDIEKIDKTKLGLDTNVLDNKGDTLQYRGIIPFSSIKVED